MQKDDSMRNFLMYLSKECIFPITTDLLLIFGQCILHSAPVFEGKNQVTREAQSCCYSLASFCHLHFWVFVVCLPVVCLFVF